MTTSTRMHGLKSNTSHRIHRNAPGISTACERRGFPGGARTAKSAPEWPDLAWDSPKSVEFGMAPPCCPGFSIFTPLSSTTANCQRHGSAPSGLVAAIACEGRCRARNIGGASPTYPARSGRERIRPFTRVSCSPCFCPPSPPCLSLGYIFFLFHHYPRTPFRPQRERMAGNMGRTGHDIIGKNGHFLNGTAECAERLNKMYSRVL